MRRYELMLLLQPDLPDDRLQAAVEKVTRAIVNAGGSLSKVSPWGKRRLAYEIGRYREASYFLIHFDIEPSQVRGIERGLLISEEIIRHLVTVIDAAGDRTERPPVAEGEAPDVEVEPTEDAAQSADAATAAGVGTDEASEEPSEATEEDPTREPVASRSAGSDEAGERS